MGEFWPVYVAFAAAWIGIVAVTLRSGSAAGRIGDRVRGLSQRPGAGRDR